MTTQLSLPLEREHLDLPPRVQWKGRQAGWKRPPGAVYVGRHRYAATAGRWGNPFRGPAAAFEFSAFLVCRAAGVAAQVWPGVQYPSVEEIRDGLAGHTLACWCAVEAACHGDPLRVVANGPADLLEQWVADTDPELLAAVVAAGRDGGGL